MTASWRRNGIWTTVVLLVGGALAYFLLVGKPAPEPVPLPEIGPPTVEAVTVDPRALALAVETQGTIAPVREINLVSRVAGMVDSVSNRFAEGGFFVAGEELLKLEDVDYQFVIARAESQVAAAAQRVAEEKGRALQASREWRDLGSVQANALFLREPQLASAQAALKAAEADLGAAELDLQRTSITAPFNGRISEKHVGLGQYVAPGAIIAKVYDTDKVQVRLPLTDRQVALLDLPLNYDAGPVMAYVGAVVDLQARFANQLWHWQGRIVRTDANIDVNSRVVYAVAEVDKPFARDSGSQRPPLAPGLFVHALISGRELPAVVVLPRTALRSDGSVMVVDSEQMTKVHPVTLLDSDSTRVWVQGLGSGDRVIVRGGVSISAGTQVSVRNVSPFSGDEE